MKKIPPAPKGENKFISAKQNSKTARDKGLEEDMRSKQKKNSVKSVQGKSTAESKKMDRMNRKGKDD